MTEETASPVHLPTPAVLTYMALLATYKADTRPVGTHSVARKALAPRVVPVDGPITPPLDVPPTPRDVRIIARVREALQARPTPIFRVLTVERTYKMPHPWAVP